MDDSIVVALITGGVTLAGTIFANYSMRKKDAVDRAKRDQLLDDKIAEMNRKLDEHNRFSDKIGNIEKAIVRIDTKMEGLHK